MGKATETNSVFELATGIQDCKAHLKWLLVWSNGLPCNGEGVHESGDGHWAPFDKEGNPRPFYLCEHHQQMLTDYRNAVAGKCGGADEYGEAVESIYRKYGVSPELANQRSRNWFHENIHKPAVKITEEYKHAGTNPET
jgi:hypothetical protein